MRVALHYCLVQEPCKPLYRGLQVGCHKFCDENLLRFAGWLSQICDENSRMRNFWWDFELKFRACANSRRKICDNQPANLCIPIITPRAHARARGYYYYYYDIEHTTEGAVCVRVGIWGENDKKLRSSNSI